MDNICIYCRYSANCKRRSRANQWTIAGCSWFEVDPVLTNSDRLRQMSDEKLAEFFGTLPCCPPGSTEELCYPENTCGADTKMMAKCWLNWLKSQVEEADT